MLKQESQRCQRSVSSPARSVVSSTEVQKQVGQTIVQLPHERQRSATSSQRGCSRLRWSRSRMSVVSSVRPCWATARSMGRTLDTDGIKELLYGSYEHRRWDDVAARCLACANCTLVCPTCFCATVEDVTDLTGDHAERWRRWDSCFTLEHSYLHGGSVRTSTRARYRQWLTHKLATWIDQFGTSGCVGCGRCITWCPVAIDITAEVAAIRAPEGPKDEPHGES